MREIKEVIKCDICEKLLNEKNEDFISFTGEIFYKGVLYSKSKSFKTDEEVINIGEVCFDCLRKLTAPKINFKDGKIIRKDVFAPASVLLKNNY